MGIVKWVKENKAMSIVILVGIIVVIYFIVLGTKQAHVAEELETPAETEGPTEGVVKELSAEAAEPETPAEEEAVEEP